MIVNYDKLWGILKERNMKKTELIKKAKLVPMPWRSLVK